MKPLLLTNVIRVMRTLEGHSGEDVFSQEHGLRNPLPVLVSILFRKSWPLQSVKTLLLTSVIRLIRILEGHSALNPLVKRHPSGQNWPKLGIGIFGK